MRHLPAHPKRIGILALPKVQMLDLAGPMDVFAEANAQAGKTLYDLHVIGTSPTLSSASGLRIIPDATLSSSSVSPFDTLLVAGTPCLTEATIPEDAKDWIITQAPDCRRLGSICTGALLLAETGLLNGHRITTHWAIAENLAQRFPAVQVEADSLFICDGSIYTAAGVTSGLDLSLALVKDDFGHELARAIAAHLVMFFRRPGGQFQFRRRGTLNPIGHSMLRDIQRHILTEPYKPADTRSLAALAGLSPRHFSRLFHAETGLTPAQWVERARIDLACRKLEQGEHPKQVAAAVGFRDIDTFRRAFQRQRAITPADYRKRHIF